MTFANRLTTLRLCLIPFFLVFVFQEQFWSRLIALGLFTGAAVTDLYDGIIARRTRSVTTLGMLLDPLADKLLVSAALIGFIQLAELHIPAWMVILILSREFLITGLRGIAAAQGRVLGAEKTGKIKTTSQVVAIITILVFLTLRSAIEGWAGPLNDWAGGSDAHRWVALLIDRGPYWILLGTTLFTGWSGYAYLRTNRDLFQHRESL